MAQAVLAPNLTIPPPADGVIARTTVVCNGEWTVGDLEGMPPRYRYEILEGVLYMAATPYAPHAAIVRNVQDLLSPWVRARNLGQVLGPQSGIYFTERNYVDPDLIYLRPDQVPRIGTRPRRAAMAVEILSPSNLRAPREDREALFLRTGVEEVWYVDYPSRSLEVRRREGEGYTTTATLRNDDRVTSPLLPGLEFPLTALWQDLGPSDEASATPE